MPLPASPSPSAWKDRIGPLLTTSLRDTSERITSHPSVQAWLHEASFAAAQTMAGTTGIQAQARAYRHMIDQLEEHFAPLAEAVRELTDGCGRLDLHWRPLEPNYSRIYIDFGRDFDVDVFCRLTALTPDEAERALQTVRAALPRGAPFPKRPNTATGLVSYDGSCIGLRFVDRLDEHGGRQRRVILLPYDREPAENLRENEAVRMLIGLFDKA